MELLGVQQTKAGILAQGEAYVQALQAAQIKMGVNIISKARSLAPKAKGTLQGAAYVRSLKQPSKSGSLVTIGFRAQHAGAIHKGEAERVGKKSGKTTKVKFHLKNGRTHFLAAVVREMRGKYAAIMAMLVKAFVASRVTPAMVPNPFPYKAPKRAPRTFGPITHAQHLKREARRARARRRQE